VRRGGRCDIHQNQKHPISRNESDN
jgi:hypothetical protein